MNFYYDEQTACDLDLFGGNNQSKSIFSLFNLARTIGGRARIKNMMKNPSSDLALLTRRTDSLDFLLSKDLKFHITNGQLDFITHYLNSNYLILKNTRIDISVQKAKNLIGKQEDYYIISTGVKYFIYSLKSLLIFSDTLIALQAPEYLNDLAQQVGQFIESNKLKSILEFVHLTHREQDVDLTIEQIFSLDQAFRLDHLKAVHAILDIIYEFDALLGIAQGGQKLEMSIPTYENSPAMFISIKDVFHPFLSNPVKNDFSMHGKNICF